VDGVVYLSIYIGVIDKKCREVQKVEYVNRGRGRYLQCLWQPKRSVCSYDHL